MPILIDSTVLIDVLRGHPAAVDRADVAAALTRRHRPAHGGIDIIDYLIAATAIEVGALVATSNIRDFPMFPGLRPPY